MNVGVVEVKKTFQCLKKWKENTNRKILVMHSGC